MKRCACGCGTPIRADYRGREPRFIKGHVVRDIILSDSALDHPYFDPRDRGVELSASRYLEMIAATDEERGAIDRGVQAVLAFEQSMIVRARRNDGRTYFESDSAEALLTKLDVPWRRQVTLLCAVARLARERGVTFRYKTSADWDARMAGASV